MKTETLQLVSHELRTPLTSIQGLSDVLLKFPVAADESREMLRTIHSDAVRLGEMINRYLDLTRLESGAQPLHLASGLLPTIDRMLRPQPDIAGGGATHQPPVTGQSERDGFARRRTASDTSRQQPAEQRDQVQPA